MLVTSLYKQDVNKTMYLYIQVKRVNYFKKFYNSFIRILFASVQFSSVAQSCPTLCDPMNCSTPGLPIHHQLPEFTQTHVHRVSDAIQASHPLSSPSPPAPNPSQHQSLFQWVNSSHEVANPHLQQLEKACRHQWRPSTTKNKYNNELI